MFDKFTTLLFGIGFACVSLAVGEWISEHFSVV